MSTATELSLSTAAVDRVAWRGRPPGRLPAYAALAAASFVFYILGRWLDGPLATLFVIGGVGACGWSWLLARALFDSTERDAWWPRVVGIVVATTGALSVLVPGDGAVARFAGNAYALSGSAALLLTFVEPFHRYRPGLPLAEKRFRVAFLAIYTLLIGVSILGLRTSDAAPADALVNDLVKSACAVAGLGAAMAAVWFRVRHPLAPERKPPVPARRAATAEDARLADRLMRLLRDEEIDRDPDLRIGDLAARLGAPEYKVSQCISAALGFPNFNRLVNHHRIGRAQRLLADADEKRSILEIAFDCGFGSVGPFNRAFRDEVGVAPSAFRRMARKP